MQREDGDAAGALDQDGGTGLEVGATESVPGGNGGAGECRGFFKAKVVGNADQAGFVEQDVFGEHAVDVAAERASDVVGSGRTVEPVLHEDAGDAIAGLANAVTPAPMAVTSPAPSEQGMRGRRSLGL